MEAKRLEELKNSVLNYLKKRQNELKIYVDDKIKYFLKN
jgi:hypothetical protein